MDASILTRKIGPLPGWAWGGLVAFGAWFFFLRGKAGTSSTGTANAAAAGSQLQSGYGLGYAQGLQANQAGQVSTPAQPSSLGKVTIRAGRQQGDWPNGPPIFVDPHRGADPANIAAYTPFQSTLPVTGPPVQGGSIAGQTTYYPVGLPGGASGYVSAADVAGVGGARGGPARKHAIGSRAAAPVWHDAHPLVGAPVRYAHYVRALGGPGNHRREVARVAQQAGVHPARIAMLNPHYTGRIRIA